MLLTMLPHSRLNIQGGHYVFPLLIPKSDEENTNSNTEGEHVYGDDWNDLNGINLNAYTM
jgi:hypothetical protein